MVGDPLFVLAVLGLGVGLGSAATAWLTRKPESLEKVVDIHLQDGRVVRMGDSATPEDVEVVRQEWERLSRLPEPTYPDPGRAV